jgi:hypothetical protein
MFAQDVHLQLQMQLQVHSWVTHQQHLEKWLPHSWVSYSPA